MKWCLANLTPAAEPASDAHNAAKPWGHTSVGPATLRRHPVATSCNNRYAIASGIGSGTKTRLPEVTVTTRSRPPVAAGMRHSNKWVTCAKSAALIQSAAVLLNPTPVWLHDYLLARYNYLPVCSHRHYVDYVIQLSGGGSPVSNAVKQLLFPHISAGSLAKLRAGGDLLRDPSSSSGKLPCWQPTPHIEGTNGLTLHPIALRYIALTSHTKLWLKMCI